MNNYYETTKDIDAKTDLSEASGVSADKNN